MKDPKTLFILSLGTYLISNLSAIIVSWNSAFALFGIPLAIVMVNLIYFIQAVGFSISYTLKTDRYYDLFGGTTFIIIVWLTLSQTGQRGLVPIIVALLVTIWALRLSTYLFIRVIKNGHDVRFDEIKSSLPRSLFAWSGQGLWISITLLPIFVILTSTVPNQITVPVIIFGIFIWLLGFSIEVIADKQKDHFKSQADNKDKFIRTGLWAISRHPNYFGEWLLWLGLVIIAIPLSRGPQFVALISTIFTYLLLVHGSGVPILENRYQIKFGQDPEYQKYLKEVPVFFPRLPMLRRKTETNL